MVISRATSFVTVVACVTVLTFGLTACQGGNARPEPTPSTAAPGPVPEVPAGLLGTCTQVLNERDRVVHLEAERSSLDIAQAVLSGTAPSSTDLARWQRTLDAGITQISTELEVLRGASTDPAWSDVLIPMEELIGRYTARLALVSGPWPAAQDAPLYGPIDLTTDVDAAAASLGMTGRDCESLASDAGPTMAFAEFVTSAAIVCSAVLDRRAEAGFTAARTTMLEAVALVAQDEPVDVTPELGEAVEIVATEWDQTADDLAVIPGAVPDDEAWATTQQAVRDRADLYALRLEVLGSGDGRAIAEAFAPDSAAPGAPDQSWAQLGLDQRDCRSLGT